MHNDRKTVIHQIHFLPWLPYVARLLCADIFILLDNVQFKTKYFINRTLIIEQGRERWLTVPTTGSQSKNTNEANICYGRNYSKIANTLSLVYRKSKYFHLLTPYIETFKRNDLFKIIDLNLSLLEIFFQQLKIDFPQIIYSSDIKIDIDDRTDKMIYLCKNLNCSTIVFGFGGSIVAHDIKKIHEKGISTEHIGKDMIYNINDAYRKYAGISFIHNLMHFGLNKTREELISIKKLWK